MEGRRIQITGIVQGVGFRPFVWGLARRFELGGWVRNSSSGVEIEVEGAGPALAAFLEALSAQPPPLARIDEVRVEAREPGGDRGFSILPSREEENAYVPVSPDMTTCPDCLREMSDPADRRHRYPFLNCTHCGPRFTIVRDIPYDRSRTTMASFPLCPRCEAEYEDPADRRFHAQPVACPACGPRLWTEESGRRTAEGEAALREARKRLACGAIVAVKGLGGFHLACDATDTAAVARLRERKRREGKPFALMAADTEAIRRHARLPAEAEAYLVSPERPIVLLERREGSPTAPGVAPARAHLGFFLPYTPLHHLLLEPAPGFPEVLVMTSGNRSDEPIAYRNEEARRTLAPLADLFLLHDREIHVRCDDSVVAVAQGAPVFLRRSRGYAPRPVRFPLRSEPVLAVGGELKNVFCLTRDDRAFLSHHIGELDYPSTWRALEEGLAHYRNLFRVEPAVVAYDLHPGYRCTRFARELARSEGLATAGVQHHHAHVASCMAEHGLGIEERVLGVAFDGTGYGPDGAIWGGEFLVAGYGSFRRALHLAYSPLPGGDGAVRNPYRTALGWLREAGIEWDGDLAPVRAAGEEERNVLEGMLAGGINAPPTSSIGRLFDAAASLAGLCQRNRYEAQAPCELEAAVHPAEAACYPFPVEEGVLDPRPALRALVEDVRSGVEPSRLAARFHNGLAGGVVRACGILRDETGLERVALSGGAWQNLRLLHLVVEGLEGAGFEVLTHREVPPNDGGLALGQAAVAAARRAAGESDSPAEEAAMEAATRAAP
jgi:hydrogenase maturation protein HypF